MRENVDQNNSEYGQFLRSVSDNSYFEISRPYVKNHDDESVMIYELHGFSDANPKAYGAIFFYLRTIKLSGEINVKVVATNSCVSPLNPHTIPRSELLGNVLLERVINYVKKALVCQVTISDHFYWTDSIISLLRIKKFDKDYKPFV